MAARTQHHGFSLIELLIVVAVIGIVAAIAIPNLLASKRAANEGSAGASLRTIHSAEATYLATAGSGQYGTIAQLRTENLIDPQLGSGSKSGYSFVCLATHLTVGPPPTYFATAAPSNLTFAGRTGTRSFTVAEDGVLRGKATDTAAANHAEATNAVTWPPTNN
ncbi:MAG: type II secretion system protein [Acidobacteriota bacterium]